MMLPRIRILNQIFSFIKNDLNFSFSLTCQLVNKGLLQLLSILYTSIYNKAFTTNSLDITQHSVLSTSELSCHAPLVDSHTVWRCCQPMDRLKQTKKKHVADEIPENNRAPCLTLCVTVNDSDACKENAISSSLSRQYVSSK